MFFRERAMKRIYLFSGEFKEVVIGSQRLNQTDKKRRICCFLRVKRAEDEFEKDVRLPREQKCQISNLLCSKLTVINPNLLPTTFN